MKLGGGHGAGVESDTSGARETNIISFGLMGVKMTLYKPFKQFTIKIKFIPEPCSDLTLLNQPKI